MVATLRLRRRPALPPPWRLRNIAAVRRRFQNPSPLGRTSSGCNTPRARIDGRMSDTSGGLRAWRMLTFATFRLLSGICCKSIVPFSFGLEQAQLVACGLIEEPDVERLLGFAGERRLRHQMVEPLAHRDRRHEGCE